MDLDDAPVFVISVAATLAGMHPQTLRQYDRLGLVSPGRARGRGRRYSSRDIATLREIQRLSHDEGINLAGIKRILDLERRVEDLERENAVLRARVGADRRVFAAGPTGDVVEVRRGQRIRRAGSGVDGGPGGAGSAPGAEVSGAEVSGALVLWRPLR